MPGTHPKKKRSEIYSEDLLQEVKTAIDNGMTIYRASVKFEIPYTTLKYKCKMGFKKLTGGQATILKPKEEAAIAKWIKEMEKRGFGRMQSQVCEAVKQVLDSAGRKVPQFTNNLPGRTWWCGFLRRNPSLDIARPDPSKEAKACKDTAVYSWFDKFEKILTEHRIQSPDQIYTCNELGFPLEIDSSETVFAERIVKRDFHPAISYQTLITTLLCVSASGTSISPTVYFPGKSLNPEYCLDFPSDVYLGISDSGWMETYHFYDWVINHFLRRVPAVRPVLLLVNGHVSHVDRKTTLKCKENGVLIHQLPQKMSHIRQPAEKEYFEIFKNEWKKASSKFSLDNPGSLVNERTFSRVFMKAFDRTARPEVIKSSFRCSGIWPVNRFAIDASSFAPTKVFKPVVVQTIDKDADGEMAMEELPSVSSDNEQTRPGTSMLQKPADDQRPVIQSLEKIEEIEGAKRVGVYETRLQEGHDADDDSLCSLRETAISNACLVGQGVNDASQSTLSEDLCSIIETVLTYPEDEKTEKKTTRKVRKIKEEWKINKTKKSRKINDEKVKTNNN